MVQRCPLNKISLYCSQNMVRILLNQLFGEREKKGKWKEITILNKFIVYVIKLQNDFGNWLHIYVLKINFFFLSLLICKIWFFFFSFLLLLCTYAIISQKIVKTDDFFRDWLWKYMFDSPKISKILRPCKIHTFFTVDFLKCAIFV